MSDRAKNLLASLDGIPMKYPESRLRTVEAHFQMAGARCESLLAINTEEGPGSTGCSLYMGHPWRHLDHMNGLDWENRSPEPHNSGSS